jgi:3-hydroxyisobutyrate dehydrogenase
MQKNTNLGWVGLGVMGEPMCGHLLAAGYSVSVFTRTKEKASQLLNNGAQWCNTPADIAEQCDVIFTMVGSEQDVREVYFSENGLFISDINGKVFIDMGTTAPSLSLEIMRYAVERGAQTVDAPVSGGDVGAKNASLSIMAGGDEGVLSDLSALFDCLGSVQIMGESGSGQHTKMCNQIVVAGTMIGVCESLVYARQAGLNCETLIAAISKGAAGCWSLENLAPRINKRDFAPGFMVNHFIKDLGIALDEAQTMKLKLPGLLLAKSLYEEVKALGFGENGTQALLLALEKY